MMLLWSIICTFAYAGPETVTSMSYYLEARDGEGRVVTSGFRASSILAVVELRNGEIIEGTYARAWTAADGARVLNFTFPSAFEVGAIRFVGVRVAPGQPAPDLAAINGFRVIALTSAKDYLLVRRPASVYPTRLSPRGSYLALPERGTRDALPPCSEVSLGVNVGDGAHSTSTLQVMIENVYGERTIQSFTGGISENARVSRTFVVPFDLSPQTVHRVSLIFIRGYRGELFASGDDIRIKSISVSAAPYGEVPQSIFANARESISLGAKRFHAYPIVNLRRINQAHMASTFGYEIFTGNDDLRVDADREKERSRFDVSFDFSAGGSLMANHPTLAEIRSPNQIFANNGTFRAVIAANPARRISELRTFKIVADLGQGSGFPFLVKDDEWEVAGIRLFYVDPSGVERTIFSDFSGQKLKWSSKTVTCDLSTQTTFVRSLSSTIMDSIPLPPRTGLLGSGG